MIKYCSVGVEGALRTIHQNYYAQLCELDDKETKNIEIEAVGDRLGDRFDHTSESKVMKFKEAMNGPDNDKWKEKKENEPKRIVINGMWKPLDKKDLPERAKVLTSTL